MRYLVYWSYFYQRFQDSPPGVRQSRSRKPAEIHRLLQEHHPIIAWKPEILQFLTPTLQSSQQALNNYWISIHATGDILARFVPSCAHWKLPHRG